MEKVVSCLTFGHSTRVPGKLVDLRAQSLTGRLTP
jgi:hypothetical protein